MAWDNNHINLKTLAELSENEVIDKMDFPNADNFFCEDCQYDKHHKQSFSKRKYKFYEPCKLIHSNFCKPISISSLIDASYFAIFKDDFSDYVPVAFLKHKCDTLEHFKKFFSAYENEHSTI